MIRFAGRHPYLSQFLLATTITLGLFLVAIFYAFTSKSSASADESELIQLAFIAVGIMVAFTLLVSYPLVAGCYQVLIFVQALRWRKAHPHRPIYDTWVLALLLGCELFYLTFAKEVQFGAGWQVVLRNSERHAPINPGHYPLFFLLIIAGMAAFFLLWVKPVQEIPPLAAVLAMGMLYICTIYVLLWTAQIFDYTDYLDLYLLLPALVFLLIVARTITITVKSYTPDLERATKFKSSPLIGRVNTLLEQARTWPIAAFLLLLPILGILYAILLLLGQGPHALIRAFTETSDWNLSQQVSPPNVEFDEHYLCTVAAGGHPKLVKPLRGGIRHGHRVLVNRQLLIANSFEQVISDHLPRLHRLIRQFYDRYGFDLAQHVKNKWAADLVWLLMKPLEWFFLVVLYLFVVHPEDLIAMQYTGRYYRHLEDLENHF